MINKIILYSLYCLSITCPRSLYPEILDSCTTHQIELIQSEICYCRFICYKMKIGDLTVNDGLEWVSDILMIAEEQLNELKEND